MNINSLQTGNQSGPLNRNVRPLFTTAQNSIEKSEVSALLLLGVKWGSAKLYGPTLQEFAEKPPEALFSVMLENCFHNCRSSGKASSAVLEYGGPHSFYVAVCFCSLVLC